MIYFKTWYMKLNHGSWGSWQNENTFDKEWRSTWSCWGQTTASMLFSTLELELPGMFGIFLFHPNQVFSSIICIFRPGKNFFLHLLINKCPTCFHCTHYVGLSACYSTCLNFLARWDNPWKSTRQQEWIPIWAVFQV